MPPPSRLMGYVGGIEILDYRETYGFQVRDAAWREHFRGKTLADPFKLDKDIPNITSATLSCRNVTNGVKRLLALHRVALSNG
jgi:Na+-translocating ferredoxin:NAD+ oxidoreductase RnfG subunit